MKPSPLSGPKTRRLSGPLGLLLVLSLTPLPAMAYIDPGSGMLLWQGLVAAVGAALVFFRRPWDVLKRLLDRLRGK